MCPSSFPTDESVGYSLSPCRAIRGVIFQLFSPVRGGRKQPTDSSVGLRTTIRQVPSGTKEFAFIGLRHFPKHISGRASRAQQQHNNND